MAEAILNFIAELATADFRAAAAYFHHSVTLLISLSVNVLKNYFPPRRK